MKTWRLFLAFAAVSALASDGSIRAAGAQMKSTSVSGTGRALTVLRQLCDTPGGVAPLVVSGPNLQWSGTVPSGREKQTALDLVTIADTPARLLLARNGPWAAVHDPGTLATSRMNCATGEMETHRIDLPAERLAVSAAGDVALLGANGQTAIDRAAEWSEPLFSGHVFTPRTDARVRVIHWAGRSLWLLDDKGVTAVGVRKDGYSDAPTSFGEHAGSPRSALSLYGLTYLLDANGCIDLVAGSPVPRVRNVTCIPIPSAAATYVSLDREALRTIRLREGVASETARPLLLKARINGPVRDVMRGVQALSAAEWIMPVPHQPRAGSISAPHASAGNDWGAAVRPDWWNSPAEFRKWVDLLASKGWTDFHQVDGWTSGAGVAFRWQTGSTFVTPGATPLRVISAQIHSSGDYTDRQIEGILASNAGLGRSLEGQLFDGRWIPIDVASAGGGRGGSAGFKGWQSADPMQQAKSLPRSVAECRWAAAVAEPRFTELVRSGIHVLNTVAAPSPKQAAAGGPQEAPAVLMRAKAAMAVPCGSAGRVLLVKEPQFAGATGSALLVQKAAIARYGLVVRSNDDANWPAAADGDLIVAVDARSDAERFEALRRWLDDVFRHDRLPRILVPASVLEMYVAADTRWRTTFQPLTNTTVLSAEIIPASARAQPACQATEFAQRRALYEKVIDLQANLPRTINQANARIGVVENSINPFHPMFVRPSNLPAWVAVDAHQRFVPVHKPAEPPPDPEDWHGMRVAGLLFSATEPTGLLGDVTMAWINAGSPDLNTVQMLAGRWNILNISQKLNADVWQSLRAKAASDWSSLLLVAAAHNANESDVDGLPLDWQLPNTIGVGVAHDDGGTPDAVLQTYSSKTVDLLAPGHRIPAAGPSAGECVDGTSYATAYVTAVAALLQQRANGGLTPWQIRARLLATATWKNAYAKHVKGGLINAHRALDGHATNLLTVDGSTGPLRFQDVTFSDDAPGFTIAGEDPASGPEVQTVGWEQILRLTRTSTVDPATKQPRVRFFVAFVHKGRYRAWHDVTVTPLAPATGAVAMPISACTRRTDGSRAVSCRGMDVNTVIDYIGQRPTDVIRVF